MKYKPFRFVYSIFVVLTTHIINDKITIASDAADVAKKTIHISSVEELKAEKKITTLTMQVKPIKVNLHYPVVISTGHPIKILSHVNGMVKNVLVKNNDVVDNKATLVTINHPNLKTKLEQSQISLNEKKARLKELEYTDNDIGMHTLEKKRLVYEVQCLTAKLQRLADKLRHCCVTAPTKGVVTDVQVKSGKPILKGDLIMSFTDAESGYATIHIPAIIINRVRHGNPAILKIKDHDFTGFIYSVSYSAAGINRAGHNANGLRYAITVRVNDPDIAQFNQQSATLSLPLVMEVVKLPSHVVQHSGQLDYVYVIENKKVIIIPVIVIGEDQDHLSIVYGLPRDVEIIVGGFEHVLFPQDMLKILLDIK